METVSAFIPMDRRHAIVNRRLLPDRTDGAVLFADISGFTALTETLSQEMGPQRGAEEISLQLDRIYGAMIACVQNYAGSVISFSGDAITCWFDDQPTGARVNHNGAMRAARCAVDIQASIRALDGVRTPYGTTIPVGVKVAVAAGVARRFLLGTPGEQRIEVLAGNLVDRTAVAEQLLRPGEIALGPEVVHCFGADLAITEWREAPGNERFALISSLATPIPPSPWYPAPPIEPDVARKWVLRPVYERIQSIQGHFLAELRPVVTMFLSFTGINYERDDSAGQKLYDYASWLSSVINHYEAYLLQLIIGDKGSYCFIVFGALQAHEDDTIRAVSAATTLSNPPPELAYITGTRIGISHGMLHVGAYGSPTRRTFGVIGNETNIAARLMSTAISGEILVSSKVMTGAESAFNFSDLGKLLLKGLARPVPVFRVAGKRQWRTSDPMRLTTATQVVGRDAERSMLREKLQQLRDHHSSTILIQGEAGIGKSRLLAGFLEDARQAGITTLIGAGDAIEQATPYHAWRPIFRAILGIDEGDTPATVRERVRRRLPDDETTTSLLPLLNTILPLQMPDNDLTAQMSGEARANSTRNLLLALLTGPGHADEPLILAFDDAHWLDSASAALLSQARRVLSPVVFLIASRSVGENDVAPTEYQRLLEAPDVERITLNSLSREQLVRLICQQLDVSEIPQAVIAFIYGHTEGHPFFSEEIAFALRDAGYILVQDGRCILANGNRDLHSLDFPATIQGVVTSRIDRLESSQQLTLKVASVLGRIFMVRVLNNIYPAASNVDRIPDQLSALERLDIILRETPAPDLAYIFKHNITQEVVYNLMTFSQRKQLHHRAAQWYESRFADDLSPYLPLLAHHWSRAEDPDRAIFYLSEAGDQALRNFANEEAIDFFSQALEIDAAAGFPTPVEKRANWELKIGEAYVHWTRYAEGQAHLEKGLALLGLPIPYTRSNIRNARHLLAAMLRQALHRLRSRRYLGSQRDDSAILLPASRAYSRLVEVYYHSGEILRATHAAFHTLNLAESAGNSPELAEAYAPIGAFFSFLRVHRITNAYFKRALNVATDVNSLPARSFVLLAKATYETGIGRWEDARVSIEELIETGQRLGAQRRYNDGLQLQSILHYCQANYEACREIGQKLLTSARQLNDLRFQGYGLFACAFGNFHLGDTGTAMSQLQELQSLFEQKNGVTDLQLALIANGLWCLIHLTRDDMPHALEAAAEATRLAEGAFQASYWTLPGYVGPAEVYLTALELERRSPHLSRRARDAVKALSRFARTFQIGAPAASLYQGWRHHLNGNHMLAQNTWRKGLQTAESMQLPYEAARMGYELVRRHDAPLAQEQENAYLAQIQQQFAVLNSTHGLRAAALASAGAPPFFTTAARD